MGLLLQLLQLLRKLFREGLQIAAVNGHAGGLHPGQHRLKGHLHCGEQLFQPAACRGQGLAEDGGETAGQMHVHGAVLGCGLHLHSSNRLVVAHQLLEAGGEKAEVTLRHITEAMATGGIQQVVRQEGIHHHPVEVQAVVQKNETVVFGVLQAFGVLLTGQPRGHAGEHQIRIQLGTGVLVPQGDIGHVIVVLSPTDANAHELGLKGIEGRGFRIQGHGFRRISGRLQAGQQCRQRRLRGDQPGRKPGTTGLMVSFMVSLVVGSMGLGHGVPSKAAAKCFQLPAQALQLQLA